VRAAPPPDAPLMMTGSHLLDASGAEASTITPGTDLTVRVECEIRERVSDLTLGLILYRSTDHLIVMKATSSRPRSVSTPRSSGATRSTSISARTSSDGP
jgi:hypothetical protein